MSNANKDRLLGQSFGSASNRLRKLIMWSFVQETGKDVCFRCEQKIEDVDDLSIEHKEPWQGATDPKESFFDLKNIAFSHLRCNYGGPRRDKTHCPQGHPYSGDNLFIASDGSRNCRKCNAERSRRYDRSQHGRDMRQKRNNRV